MTTMNKKDSFLKLFNSYEFYYFLVEYLDISETYFAFLLGASPLADSFLLHFRIPNFFRRLFWLKVQ